MPGAAPSFGQFQAAAEVHRSVLLWKARNQAWALIIAKWPDLRQCAREMRQEIWSPRDPRIARPKTPQALGIDAIPPIGKHGGMVQKTAVQALSTALARARVGVRPLSHSGAELEDHRPSASLGGLDSGVSSFDRAHSNRNSGRIECDASRRKQKTEAHSNRHS